MKHNHKLQTKTLLNNLILWIQLIAITLCFLYKIIPIENNLLIQILTTKYVLLVITNT